MLKKYPKFVLILVLFCLIGAGVFCFLNIQKEKSAHTTPSLKLLTSHSSPEAGENWVVSFETKGVSDLTIIPKDPDSINDLGFISLECGGETRSPQILGNDIISYSGWQCLGKGELIHLVNIARKHTLKFQFGNKLAFAYNNPDSVTDTFTDTSKVSATSSVTVSGGGARLSTCGGSGGVCSGDGDCCSGLHCQNSVCCAAGQTCCSSDGHCSADSCLATCQKRDNYCDTTTDHYCKYTDSYCAQNYWCSSGSCTSTGACGYSAYSCNGTCQRKRDIYRCDASHNCAYDTGEDNTEDCASNQKCSGGTCGTGPCAASVCLQYCPDLISCYYSCDYYCSSGSCTVSCHYHSCPE